MTLYFYSRITKFETCPLAYKLDVHLISKLIREEKLDPDLMKQIQKFQETEHVKQIFLSKLEGASN